MFENAEPIDEKYLDDICLLGHDEKACRYILFAAAFDNFYCAKDNENAKFMIDLSADQLFAKGDNCDGYKTRSLKNEI